MLKFNMGCGRRKLDGFVNVDAWPGSEPDEVWNLERTPWPWADGCADEVMFSHSLEHMGGDPAVFLAIIKELYRICADGAVVTIHVPHPRHDHFAHDPTHVRAIYPDTLRMFDASLNAEWAQKGHANTPLAQITGVDFEVFDVVTILSPPYFSALKEGRMKPEEVNEAVNSRWNVATTFKIRMRAHKPSR